MSRRNQCRLDHNNEIVTYHAASPIGGKPYNHEKFQYIGDGVIHFTGGTLWRGTARFSFYKVIKKQSRHSGKRQSLPAFLMPQSGL